MSINRHNRIVVIYSVTSLSNLWPECQKRAQLLHNAICVNVTDVETVSLLWLWFASRGRIETSEARNRSVSIWCVHSLTAKQSCGFWQFQWGHTDSVTHREPPSSWLSYRLFVTFLHEKHCLSAAAVRRLTAKTFNSWLSPPQLCCIYHFWKQSWSATTTL